jgi:PPM family protein phosphatase
MTLRAADTVRLTDTGRARRDNEDSSYARAPVFVVADGMGGAQAGEVASRLVIDAFEQGLPAAGTPEERLSTVVQTANRNIWDRASAESSYDGMGTTVTAAYIDDAGVAIAHVGDSRAYLLRGEELTRLTQDHSLMEELIQAGKLTEEEAAEHPQRSIITRALGPDPIVEVDTFTYPVNAGDVILLCSDGLTSMISEAQIAAVLTSTSSLEQAGRKLIDAANAAGGRDNITVVLFRVEEVETGSAEEPTVVGVAGTGLPASALPETAAMDPAELQPVAAPVLRSKRREKTPLAKTQGRTKTPGPWVIPAERERHWNWWGKTAAALVAIAVVLGFALSGGYLATRQLYFLGTNRQGIVVLYRGLPYKLPFGFNLYETYYVSGVPAQTIPVDRRGDLLNHDLHAQNSGIKLINDLELGKISGG